MMQVAPRLNARAVDLVRRAWDSLETRYRKSPSGSHWTDNEADTGPLKDADGLLCIIEPFLLAPESFVEPAIPPDEIWQRCREILEEVQSLGDRSSGSEYRGFTAAPYPYTNEIVDYVDAAATYLRLICGTSEISDILHAQPPDALIALQQQTAKSAVEFLLEARIEDRAGVRWAGTAVKFEGAPPLADLFFTTVAALALKRAIENSVVSVWIGDENLNAARSAIRHVAKWVGAQFASNVQNFWMDEAKTIVQPVGVVYAIEAIYTLLPEVSDALRTNCLAALHSIAQRIPSVEGASTLQTDFYHKVPLPNGSAMAYDDRRYIGAFLTAFALMKARDADALTDPLIRAADILMAGVTTEWIDEPSGMWDDGRPLICYTHDALIAVVRYFLEGIIPTISLRENTLRDAVRQALSSPEVVDTVVELLKGKALGQVQEQIVGGMAAAGPK